MKKVNHKIELLAMTKRTVRFPQKLLLYETH